MTEPTWANGCEWIDLAGEMRPIEDYEVLRAHTAVAVLKRDRDPDNIGAVMGLRITFAKGDVYAPAAALSDAEVEKLQEIVDDILSGNRPVSFDAWTLYGSRAAVADRTPGVL